MWDKKEYWLSARCVRGATTRSPKALTSDLGPVPRQGISPSRGSEMQGYRIQISYTHATSNSA